jgi:hypothetical protein
MEPKVALMEQVGEQLKTKSSADLIHYLTTKMDDIDCRCADVQRLANAKHDSLKDAYNRGDQVYAQVDALSAFLTTVDEELSGPINPESGKDLQALIKRHKVSSV